MTVEVPGFFDYEPFYQKVIDKFDHRPWTAVEVGVYQGASALYLLKNSENLTLHLVDHFKNTSIHCALTYLRNYFDKIVIHPTDSVKSAKHFGNDRTFDFVFLDADHSYDGLLADLSAYYPLLFGGGVIAGHDYSHPKYKVKKAVDKFLGTEYNVWENRVWYAGL